MSATEQQKMKQWVNTWKQAGKELVEIKKRELKAYDFSKNQIALDEMLSWACENAQLRNSSGLVDQQRWFMKWRKKLIQKGLK